MIEIPTVRRRLLGGELRRLRAAAEFTLEDAAQVLECDRSKISRIETGHRGIRPKELRELLTAYGIDERRRYAMADLARRLTNRGWWQEFDQVLPRPYVDLVSLEIGAAAEWTFEAQAVPALLQTEAYARRIVAAAGQVTDPRDRDLVVAARMMRQQIWAQWTAPPQLWVVLGEAALRQQVGDPQLMRDELDHLLTAYDTFRRLTLQVLPFDVGAHAGTAGSFTGLSFPDPTGLAVVYTNTLTGGLWIEAPEHVDAHRRAFNDLTAVALPPEESITFIEKVAHQL